MLNWLEHLPDPVKAALVVGSVQVVTGSLTAFVAWYALSSWRRTALGNREIELAESCLKAVWELDALIHKARFNLIPINLKGYRENQRIRELYKERHSASLEAMKASVRELEELKKLLTLLELYLGTIPGTRLKNTHRLFKTAEYSIQIEYDELIGALLVCLSRIHPETIDKLPEDCSEDNEYYKSADLFNGFFYEYERDDYSYRLILVRKSFERYIKRTLKRKRSFLGLRERADDAVEMFFVKRFKPVLVNKMPFRPYVDNDGRLM